jgi:hypothetical protein
MANRRQTKCPPFQFKALEQLEQELLQQAQVPEE